MRLLILIASSWALVASKPEIYKEKEDFQYSRSSSDDGSKSGYYGAQRGNMGGNYERAHNMDSLAQHQMSTLVRNVDGELGEGANTKTGSVFAAANSRGLYGSGNYDLSNLRGRNFGEGTISGDSLSQSASSQKSGYSDYSRYENSYSAANKHSSSRAQNSGHSSGFQSSGLASQYLQTDAQKAADNIYGARNYEYDSQGANNYKYAQSSSQARSDYENSNSANANSDHKTSSSLIYATPVRVYVRPGTRIAIPVAAQVYDTNAVQGLNTVHSDSEILDTNGQRVYYKPTNNAKHYESSYSYRKEWEKQNSIPVTVGPTESPFPTNSELYEDAHLSQLANSQYESDLASAVNSHASSANSAYLSGYSGSTKNALSSQSRHQSQAYNSGASALNAYNYGASASNAYKSGASDSSAYTHNAYDAAAANLLSSHISDGTVNSNNLVEGIDSKPKSYHSSYSYHKSWERRGDPYIIKPVGGEQASQRLTAASAKQGYACTYCLDDSQQRVRRSITTDDQQSDNLHDGQEDMGQQSIHGWQDSEDLGQQTQNKWDELGSFNQQPQSQLGNLEDLGQQTQNQWDKLEGLSQQPQTQDQLEDLGQQTQSHWGKLEDLDQKPQTQQRLEDLGQQIQNQWDNHGDLNQQTQAYVGKLEDLGQQTQSHWGKLEDLDQKPQTQQRLEDLGQQIQNQWDNLGDLNQQTQAYVGKLEDLGQQTETQWDKLGDLSQQTQSHWEDLGQQIQNQWDNLGDLNQQTQAYVNKLEDLGQQTQSHWGKLEDLDQKPQSQHRLEDLGQQTQNQWDNLGNLNQQTQDYVGKLEDLGQQTQTQWDKLGDLSQQTQSHWGKLEDLGQQTQTQWDKLGDLSQQTQSHWGKLENFGQKPQSNWENHGTLDQQTQPHWGKVDDLGQNNQNNWDIHENQQTQSHWGKLEDLGQQTQSKLDNLEKVGQQSQNKWSYLDNLGQQENLGQQGQSQNVANFGQETQNTANGYGGYQFYKTWTVDGRFVPSYTNYRDINGLPYYVQDPLENINKRWDCHNLEHGSYFHHHNIDLKESQFATHNSDFLFNVNHLEPSEKPKQNTAQNSGDKPEIDINIQRETTTVNYVTSDEKTPETTQKTINTDEDQDNSSTLANIHPIDIGRGDIGPEDTSIETTNINEKNYKTPEEIESLSLTKDQIDISKEPLNLSVTSLHEQNKQKNLKELSSVIESVTTSTTKPKENLHSKIINVIPIIDDSTPKSHFLSSSGNHAFNDQQNELKQIPASNEQQSEKKISDNFGQHNWVQQTQSLDQQNMEQYLEPFKNQDVAQQLDLFEEQNMRQDVQSFEEQNMVQQSEFFEKQNLGQHLEHIGEKDMVQQLEPFRIQNLGQDLKPLETKHIGQQFENVEQHLGQQNVEQHLEPFEEQNMELLQTIEQLETNQKIAGQLQNSDTKNGRKLLDIPEEHTVRMNSQDDFDQQVQMSADKNILQNSQTNSKRFKTSPDSMYVQEQNIQYKSQNVEPTKSHDDISPPIEPTTEKPGFWGKVWNKTKHAKESVVSWFSS
ncbi:putative uncharacterized protein DDB_G0271606 isoform X2 [Maniola hyperantus]|uniref:putative uncharacterized protein DDB_G0271606 isoform X2 n=1 Tax=Aphantopus hyperantus TaxID=2795564 RepID=UPI003747E32A